MTVEKPKARKANLQDIESIFDLLRPYVASGIILPKTRIQLYSNIRDYFVYVDEKEQLLGTAGLHICWKDLVEIRSLAVAESFQGRGIGRALIKVCIDEATSMGLKQVFVLTNNPAFFSYMGFIEVAKEQMPLKIWMDCVNCVKYPDDCDEIPMIFKVQE